MSKYHHKPPPLPKDPMLENRLFEFRMKMNNLKKQTVYAAESLGVTRMQLWRWESGTQLPNEDKISLVCAYYGAPIEVLWPRIGEIIEQQRKENSHA